MVLIVHYANVWLASIWELGLMQKFYGWMTISSHLELETLSVSFVISLHELVINEIYITWLKACFLQFFKLILIRVKVFIAIAFLHYIRQLRFWHCILPRRISIHSRNGCDWGLTCSTVVCQLENIRALELVHLLIEWSHRSKLWALVWRRLTLMRLPFLKDDVLLAGQMIYFLVYVEIFLPEIWNHEPPWSEYLEHMTLDPVLLEPLEDFDLNEIVKCILEPGSVDFL